MHLAIVFLIGSVAQLVDGTLGMGFGVLSASLLLLAGITPTTVVGTVNLAKIVSGAFSGVSHWRAGNVRPDWLLPLILPGIIGGAVGASLITFQQPERVRVWMSAVLVGMGALMLVRTFFPGLPSLRSGANGRCRWYLRLRFGLSALGLAAGFLNALSGAYGPFATSAVMLAGRASPRFAVGTVSLAEFFVAGTVVSTLLYGSGPSTFSWDLATALALGGAATAPLAASVCRRLPPRMLAFGAGLALIALNIVVAVSFIR